MRRALLVTVLLLAGCTAQPEAAAQPVHTPPGVDCPSAAKVGKPVRFGDTDALAGVVVGTGPKAVVLAHMAPGSLCQWLGTAAELAEQGYTALAFDFNGAGGSDLTTHLGTQDVADAVAYLRKQGATSISLVGASRGGTAVVTAAAQIDPPVNAVISLSAPIAFAGMNALNVAGKVTAPVQYFAAELDRTFADQSQQLYDASASSRDRRILLVGGTAHGVALVGLDGNVQVKAAFTEFLKTYA